jgi:L-alanine-DL-glutamate epimerase-like enolase superfamily enzyme
MMKIISVEAIPFYIPFDPELSLKFAYRISSAAEHVFVRIRTDEGITGIAEAPARPQIYGETQQSIVAAIETHLAPSLLGSDPFDLEKIHAMMDRLVHNLTAKASIDIAIHDILGKALHLPLFKLLGSGTDQPIPLSWMVGIRGKEEMIRECERFLSMGIKAFKLKIGLNPKEDVENFKAIRKGLGEEVLLYVDGNQAYPPKVAMKVIRELEPYGLAWVEEPSPVWDEKGRAELAKSISVPILGDESCFTPRDVLRELELGAVGMVLIKVARTGFYQTRKIIHLCQERNIPCMIGSQGDSSIGAAASAHVASSFKNILFPAECSYHLRMKGELLKTPLSLSKGTLEVPKAPGLGIEVEESKLAEFRQSFSG